MNKPQPKNPQAAQARAKIEQMKRSFEQKRAISDSLSGIGSKIGVYSGKGGVGKSQFVVSAAVLFRQEGRKVLLVDADVDGVFTDFPDRVLSFTK